MNPGGKKGFFFRFLGHGHAKTETEHTFSAWTIFILSRPRKESSFFLDFGHCPLDGETVFAHITHLFVLLYLYLCQRDCSNILKIMFRHSYSQPWLSHIEFLFLFNMFSSSHSPWPCPSRSGRSRREAWKFRPHPLLTERLTRRRFTGGGYQ